MRVDIRVMVDRKANADSKRQYPKLVRLPEHVRAGYRRRIGSLSRTARTSVSIKESYYFPAIVSTVALA